MSSLTAAEKVYFEDVLDMSGGYVLDFYNSTFEDFFRSHGIEIYGDEKYCKHGESKARRLRAFWEQDPDEVVARVLSDLLDRYEAICITQGHERKVNVLGKCRDTIGRLTGQTNDTRNARPAAIDEFLNENVDIPNLQKLPVESAVLDVIKSRLREAEIVADVGAHLSAIILWGSVLEAVLLGVAQSNPKQFSQSGSSPKTRDEKVRRFHEWSLSDLINVACEQGFVKPDIKRFGEGLRDYRNYVHPYQTLHSNFTPDEHTAAICFQVLKAALASVAGER